MSPFTLNWSTQCLQETTQYLYIVFSHILFSRREQQLIVLLFSLSGLFSWKVFILGFMHHSSRCRLCLNPSRALSWKHSTNHHLHPINSFFQVTINKSNQDVQRRRETPHDISLNEHSQSEFYFCNLKRMNETWSIESQVVHKHLLTRWESEKWVEVKCGTDVELDLTIDQGEMIMSICTLMDFKWLAGIMTKWKQSSAASFP